MLLRVTDHRKKQAFEAPEGQNLQETLRKRGYFIPAPCGGKGTCGKCQVEITGLGKVLACQTFLTRELYAQAGLDPEGTLEIRLQQPVRTQIAKDGVMPDLVLTPRVFKASVALPAPSLEDQRPDDERFEKATGCRLPFFLLKELPVALGASDYHPSYFFFAGQSGQCGEVIRFVSPDSSEPLGVAVDIGTSTLAAWLYDLDSGQRLASVADLNPQQAYGADVISRIEFAGKSPENREIMRQTIASAITGLAEKLAARASAKTGRPIALTDICHYVLAGNTTMIHLLAGLPAAAIASSPFTPVTLKSHTLRASELGLPVAGDAVCQILPSISSYVGADITAGILACRLDPHGKRGAGGLRPAILLDIGTNGEIVLAGPAGMVACSTAAGPAFEGACILCGIGGVEGAIDEFEMENGELTWSLIGGSNGSDLKARGICGSGLVAAVAVLLEEGLIEPSGRITDRPDSLPAGLAGRITRYQGQPAILLVGSEDTETGSPIILTQKDIREVQNAKAAIAAGIGLLIVRSGLKTDDISQVWLAGGFGNYLDVVHAFRIGLLPEKLRGKTKAVGNTSGMGAIMCLLQAGSLARTEEAARNVHYIELSSDRDFTDLYVDAMFFPEPSP